MFLRMWIDSSSLTTKTINICLHVEVLDLQLNRFNKQFSFCVKYVCDFVVVVCLHLCAGVALTQKNCFLRKKSRLRKSENAVHLLYAKNSDLTHQNAFSLFVFCTHQRRFVEHLPWV